MRIGVPRFRRYLHWSRRLSSYLQKHIPQSLPRPMSRPQGFHPAELQTHAPLSPTLAEFVPRATSAAAQILIPVRPPAHHPVLLHQSESAPNRVDHTNSFEFRPALSSPLLSSPTSAIPCASELPSRNPSRPSRPPPPPSSVIHQLLPELL